MPTPGEVAPSMPAWVQQAPFPKPADPKYAAGQPPREPRYYGNEGIHAELAAIRAELTTLRQRFMPDSGNLLLITGQEAVDAFAKLKRWGVGKDGRPEWAERET